jgi:hypothetical protein
LRKLRLSPWLCAVGSWRRDLPRQKRLGVFFVTDAVAATTEREELDSLGPAMYGQIPDIVFHDKAAPDEPYVHVFWLLPDGTKLCLEN